MIFVELIRVVGCRLSQHFNRTEEASSRKAYVWLGAKRPLNKLQARALTWVRSFHSLVTKDVTAF